jgi:hypothetical protein
MRQGTSGFIHVFQFYLEHVSASGCHLQGVVGALEAAQVVSALWAYTDYTFHYKWPYWTDRNPYTPTI